MQQLVQLEIDHQATQPKCEETCVVNIPKLGGK